MLSSRNDTVRYALDVLAILTVVPKIQLQLAEPVDVLDEAGSTVSTVGKQNMVLMTYTFVSCLLLHGFWLAVPHYSKTRVKVINVLRVTVKDANKWESALWLKLCHD